MPQLIPFYFFHLLAYLILFLIFILFLVAYFLLPNILKLFISRFTIIKI